MLHLYRTAGLLALLLGCLWPAAAQQLSPLAAPAAGAPGPQPPTALAPEPHYTHAVDSLLHPLDKSQVPTGLLYDRALPLA